MIPMGTSAALHRQWYKDRGVLRHFLLAGPRGQVKSCSEHADFMIVSQGNSMLDQCPDQVAWLQRQPVRSLRPFLTFADLDAPQAVHISLGSMQDMAVSTTNEGGG
jgi:hypothetical protein